MLILSCCPCARHAQGTPVIETDSGVVSGPSRPGGAEQPARPSQPTGVAARLGGSPGTWGPPGPWGAGACTSPAGGRLPACGQSPLLPALFQQVLAGRREPQPLYPLLPSSCPHMPVHLSYLALKCHLLLPFLTLSLCLDGCWLVAGLAVSFSPERSGKRAQDEPLSPFALTQPAEGSIMNTSTSQARKPTCATLTGPAGG